MLDIRQVRMDDRQWEMFKKLGSAKWLRNYLDEQIKKETSCEAAVTNTAPTTDAIKDGTVRSVWRHIAR